MAFFFGQKTTKPAVYKAETVLKKSVSIQKYTQNIPSVRKKWMAQRRRRGVFDGKTGFCVKRAAIDFTY
jgi:hypothetical protein